MTGKQAHPVERRERAVRVVQEHRGEYPSEWAALVSIAQTLGIGAPETLRQWVRRTEVDAGRRPGITSGERERLQQLERENRELRRLNEILRAAAAFFARGLDPQPPKP